ncbi:uncharacterized protein T551_01744 [Pneumocystis jirovecii RU7]|uniref:SAM-dependent MTase RsmB/NOP-type domain-containing protein n=1 Tax=Pneumocystis jirovecii (strain RU7) TaxID=1408657 RepID=A0A0W4ZQ13_PNEJ7|nr:uncharacterized protein T551_01744 [Pneumocystis jirovecii RU7]KTW30461.1 hypothetical protein T551_01744 [Pneumocystis jirovecii RU7]
MEDYYKKQGILEDDEWDVFMDCIKTSLPTTFRISGSKKHSFIVKRHFENEYFPLFSGLKHEDKEIAHPIPISWYPDQLGYSLDVPKAVIRKNKAFKSFQDWLFYETESGNISRQEAVSMIPALLLDVKSHHSVIDLCASPGSKTAQLLEAIHANINDGDESLNSNVSQIYPRGFLIANDVDFKRAYMLVHQVKRFNSPCMIVTNHDASKLPNFFVDEGIDTLSEPSKTSKKRILKFDRVLADVPCTGDGTIRKNLNLWKDWDVRQAFGLHLSQVNILIRGLQLLKVHGKLVYSTCSLNPIENEAVVSSVLRTYGNSIRLVDVSDQLPELKRRKGICVWKVIDNNGEIIEFDERISMNNKKMPRSLWPPSEEEVEKFSLERCLRIYPHLQNTGGFFVAVFEKIGKLNDSGGNNSEENLNKQKRESNDLEMNIVQEASVPLKKIKTETSFIDERIHSESILENIISHNDNLFNPLNPTEEMQEKDSKFQKISEYFKFLPENHEEIKHIKSFYNISDSFPSSEYVIRNVNGVPTRFIYFLSKKIKNILYHNENRIKFVHGGVKMFTKHELPKNVSAENNCRWRIQNEGIEILFPWIGPERVVHVGFKELKIFLDYGYPKIDMFPEGEARTSLEKMSLGCAIMEANLENDDNVKMKFKVVVPIWKSNVSANLMLSKKDRNVLMLRLFGSLYRPKDDFKDDPKDDSKDDPKDNSKDDDSSIFVSDNIDI